MSARAVFAALGLLVWMVVPAWGTAEPSLQKVEVNLPFEEVELIVISEMQARNLNLVNTLDIKKGMENRGGTFRKYKIFQFCNLELGIRIYRDAPEYGAMQFCSLLVYEVLEGRTGLAATRQTWALRQLADHTPGGEAVEAARELERRVAEILAAVVEEAKAKGR